MANTDSPLSAVSSKPENVVNFAKNARRWSHPCGFIDRSPMITRFNDPSCRRRAIRIRSNSSAGLRVPRCQNHRNDLLKRTSNDWRRFSENDFSAVEIPSTVGSRSVDAFS
jgi:hypothetical protein